MDGKDEKEEEEEEAFEVIVIERDYSRGTKTRFEKKIPHDLEKRVWLQFLSFFLFFYLSKLFFNGWCSWVT